MIQCIVLLNSTFSQDIASADYHLFQSMSHGLSEQRFTYENTKKWINSWIPSKDELFFDIEIEYWQKDGKRVAPRNGRY